MTFDEHLAALVRDAVADAVEPLRAEIAQLRVQKDEAGLTLDEVAKRLRVTRRQVNRLIAEGKLPVIAGVRPRRVRLSDVLKSAA